MILLTEYHNLYCGIKDIYEKDTNKIITNPARFIKKMRFPKFLYQIDNYSGSITIEVVDPRTYHQRLYMAPLTVIDLAALPTLYERQVMGMHHSGPA